MTDGAIMICPHCHLVMDAYGEVVHHSKSPSSERKPGLLYTCSSCQCIKIIELGNGDVAIGLQKAFDGGFMDTPFSSNVNTKGQVLGVRDLKGACRYLDMGNLPLPEEAKAYNREKIAEREKAEGRKLDYHTVVEEFWAFANAKLM